MVRDDHDCGWRNNPRIGPAIEELTDLVRSLYPGATFEVGEGEDPPGVYIWASVDVDDTDNVLDVVIDRLLEIQIDEQLPVYVIPTRPLRSISGQVEPRCKGFEYLFESSRVAS